MPKSIRNVTAPNLPTTPVQYDQRFFDQLINILRLFFNTVTNRLNSPQPYGSFFDTTTQTNPVANAVNPMRLNNTLTSAGIYVGSPQSRIYVTETGAYNIQFSVQADKSGGSADSLYIWLRKNGVDVAYSASKVVVNGPTSEIIPAWNFLVALEGGDYVELVWSSADVNMVLAAYAASAPVPTVPSVIITVTWVSNLPV